MWVGAGVFRFNERKRVDAWEEGSMRKVKQFFVEVWQEFRYRVTWPTAEELQRVTVAVLVTFVLFTVAIALMDFVSSRVLRVLYEFLAG